MRRSLNGFLDYECDEPNSSGTGVLPVRSEPDFYFGKLAGETPALLNIV